jgi:phosphoribosylformylglycinamidine synthase subunit PurQ / glutaminase
MMKNVEAIVLRAAGINCDLETVNALEMAGAKADSAHINTLIANKESLKAAQILVFPGGFSYGDDVAAGKILANQVIHHLSDVINEFIDAGKLVLGICNGFQVLVKAGILPGMVDCRDAASVTITNNDIPRFYDNWVHLQPGTDRCVFINKDQRIYLPMAHGEGKVVTQTPQILEKLRNDGHVAFRYVDADGNFGGYPVNPNGSTDHIAGLCDSTGRVLGLMPHPERFVRRSQHPHWTRLPEDISADGMTIFNNAINYIKNNM